MTDSMTPLAAPLPLEAHATGDAAADAIHGPPMSNPMPIAFALFAFALCVYGVRFVSVDAHTVAAGPATEAVIYAILAAGIAQLLAGVLGVIRGLSFQSYVTATFGIWLLGLYLLLSQGTKEKAFTPDAIGWYVLILIVPVAILAVPEFIKRNVPFCIAFVALIVVLLLLGLGYHFLHNDLANASVKKQPPHLSAVVALLKTSAYFAFIAGAAIWYVMARDVYRILGIIGPSPCSETL